MGANGQAQFTCFPRVPAASCRQRSRVPGRAWRPSESAAPPTCPPSRNGACSSPPSGSWSPGDGRVPSVPALSAGLGTASPAGRSVQAGMKVRGEGQCGIEETLVVMLFVGVNLSQDFKLKTVFVSVCTWKIFRGGGPKTDI